YISVDFLDKTVSVVRMKNVVGEPDPLAMTIDLGEGKGQKQIWFESPTIDPGNAIRMELETFANAILTNTRPLVPIEDGLKALDVAHKIVDQLRMNANFAAGNAINA
ncbi:MAG TPA: gfo/Idh/MocA family oxidoreductase, partial [Bacteroidia bacterium]|nr:gfo/Idh/MocA family oxidoreductase [Bacteroidia bacterium]